MALFFQDKIKLKKTKKNGQTPMRQKHYFLLVHIYYACIHYLPTIDHWELMGGIGNRNFFLYLFPMDLQKIS